MKIIISVICDDSGKEDVIGEAAAGEFPWQAILYKRNEERWEQFCSGFLINPKFVLSGKYFSFNRYSMTEQDDIFLYHGKGRNI